MAEYVLGFELGWLSDRYRRRVGHGGHCCRGHHQRGHGQHSGGGWVSVNLRRGRRRAPDDDIGCTSVGTRDVFYFYYFGSSCISIHFLFADMFVVDQSRVPVHEWYRFTCASVHRSMVSGSREGSRFVVIMYEDCPHGLMIVLC